MIFSNLKNNTFLKRVTSGILDLLPLFIIFLCVSIIVTYLVKQFNFWAIVFIYLLFSVLYIIPLSILQKKKINLGYKLTGVLILDEKTNEIPNIFKLILRNSFIIILHNPAFILRLIFIFFIIMNIISYFNFKRKNRRCFMWDWALKTYCNEE